MLGALLTGCSTTSGLKSQVDQYNQMQARQYSPYRAVYKEGSGGAVSMEMGVWAGEVGSTAANMQYQQGIFDVFQERCGLARADIREVRVVRHAPPTEWYEVWVFNAPTSKRYDKSSGLAVVMKYDPSTNRTDVSFYGSCKS